MKEDENCPKKKYERFRYTQTILEKALKAIANGEISINKASKVYCIPKSTLHNKITYKVPWERKMGPQSELGCDEETKLAQWIINKAKLGFPMHPEEVYDTVQNFLKSTQRKTKFTDNRPGRKWLDLFLNRFPEITKRQAELISKARAAVTEENIRNWFMELDQYLTEENVMDIKDDPSRIFNTDETGVMTCPKSGMILGPKNYKNTYEIANGKEKESITVLCTFSADGNDVPSFVVYPYKRMPQSVVQSFPDDWYIGRSDSGWMVSATFFDYIKLFHSWLIANGLKLPVLLFLDGHKSHINQDMFEFCVMNGIMLFCLYPNATHIIQPCDVGIFGPIKKNWKRIVRKHKQETTTPINKQNFALKFQEAYREGLKESTVKKAFKACGLYPVDPEAVDYSKCINTRRQEIEKEQLTTNLSGIPNNTEEHRDNLRSTIKVIESEIGQKTRNEFVEFHKNCRPHSHPYYALWAKCRDGLNPDFRKPAISGPTTTNDKPLDLSDTSMNTSFIARTSPGKSHGQSERHEDLVDNDCPSSPLNTNRVHSENNIVTTIVEIHTGPNDSILPENNRNVEETYSVIMDDTELFGDSIVPEFERTDEILEFIINREDDITPSIIPLPWHETLSINHDVMLDDSIIISDHRISILDSPLEPSLDKLDSTIVEESTVSDQAKVSGPNVQSENNQPKSKTTNISSFLKYPEISRKKPKILKKKEPMPFGLTGKKYKEYFLKIENEKRQKNEEMEMKRKKREEKKVIQKRKTEEKNNEKSQPPKKSHKKDTSTSASSTDKSIAGHNTPTCKKSSASPLVEKRSKLDTKELDGKYVIARFKTDKRMRHFVGKVLMVNEEEEKLKIDFLRKKSVAANVVSFIKPHISDIEEVNVCDIKCVLKDPIVSRRGLMSFADVSFKDVE